MISIYVGIPLHEHEVCPQAEEQHLLRPVVSVTTDDQQRGIQTRYDQLPRVTDHACMSPLHMHPPASHVTQLPSLNFLIYVPRQSESPLLIQAPSRASESKTLTDNFLVPQWGGMVIYNSEDPYEGASGGGSEVPRVRVKMERLMPIFVEHLKMLLGVPDMVIQVQWRHS